MSEDAAQSGPEWSPEARSLFDELMEKGPPESMRDAAKRGVRRESERLARLRGATQIELDDVAAACLAMAPPIFRPNVLADLASRGLDVGRLCAATELDQGIVLTPRKEAV